jgi:hypothetical protein
MKKTFFVLFAVFSLLAPLFTKALAESLDSPSNSPSSGWYLGTGLGIDAPTQGWNPDFPLGGGGNIIVGCHLNSALSLQLSVSPLFFTGNGLSVVDVRVSPELKFLNPGKGWAPYVLMGPGYDFQFNSPTGYTTSSAAAVLGVGFQFDFRRGEHAFIEGRYDFLIYNNLTQEDVPVLVGLTEDL